MFGFDALGNLSMQGNLGSDLPLSALSTLAAAFLALTAFSACAAEPFDMAMVE